MGTIIDHPDRRHLIIESPQQASILPVKPVPAHPIPTVPKAHLG